MERKGEENADKKMRKIPKKSKIQITSIRKRNHNLSKFQFYKFPKNFDLHTDYFSLNPWEQIINEASFIK